MPEILVEVVPDFSKLQNATDQLESSGQLSRPIVEEFKKVGKAADDAAAHVAKDGTTMAKSLNGLSGVLKGISKEMITGFKDGLKVSLNEANKAAMNLHATFEEVYGDLQPLTTRMGEMEDRLYELAAAGKKDSDEFRALQTEVVKMKKVILETDEAVDRFTNGTAKIEGVMSVVGGVAASFSVAEGAMALMGESSEELQEGIMRLQATMAVLSGVQELSIVLSRKSAAVQAVERTQRLASVAAQNLETAATSKNVVIKGIATVAMRALNAVMSANPVFLLISAFAALAGALAYFSSRSKEAKIDTEALTLAMDRQNEKLTDNLSTIQHNTKMTIAQLKERGATEQELHAAAMKGLADEAKAAEESAKDVDRGYNIRINGQKLFINSLSSATAAYNRIQREIARATDEDIKAGLSTQLNMVNTVLTGYRTAGDKRRQIEEDTANFTAEQAEKVRQKAKEAEDKRKEDAKAAAEKRKELETQRLNDIKAGIEAELLAVEQGTGKQLALQIKLAEAERDISTFGAKSAAEKKLIHAQFLKSVKDLTEAYYKEERTKAIQAQADVLSAQLQNERLSADEREVLQVELMERQRSLELIGVVNNKAKEQEINARFDREIANQRLAIRQEAFEKEEELITIQAAARNRRLEEVAANERNSERVRLLAIADRERADTEAVGRRMENNENLFKAGLITEQEYRKNTKKLEDEYTLIHEGAEKRRSDITKEEHEKRKEQRKEEILNTLEMAQQALGAYNDLAQAFADRALANLEGQRKALDQQKEAGTITEKEYLARTKRIEAMEAAAKRRAAVREKAVALFSAAIQGARAIIEAAPNIPLQILTGVMVAAQIAAIAARPIPKFGRGVRSAPKGLAEVGETGPELVHKNGRWMLADQPQVVWLEGGERVYNPVETARIFEKETPVSLPADLRARGASNSLTINYNRLSKAIGEELKRHPRNVINMDERGFTRHVVSNLSRSSYLNKRYTFHD